MILRIVDIEDPDNKRLQILRSFETNGTLDDFLTEMRIEAVFAFGFPKDKMEDLQRAQIEAQLKIGSRREWMERLGKNNVPELMQEIDEDMVNVAAQEAVAQATSQKILMEAASSMQPQEPEPAGEPTEEIVEEEPVEGEETE